ncbi:MAG: peroxide stress protein YaaA [Bacteroidota bacterium]
MIVLLSPAKTLDLEQTENSTYSESRFEKESETLVSTLREKSIPELRSLMNISENLAETNRERYLNFHQPFDLDNAKQAILTFKGDVYQGLNVDDFSKADLAFAQDHLRILSGLYGVLRPMDLMQAYRLEMGTKLQQNGSKNLYEFWDDKVTQAINHDQQQSGSDYIVNLASNEYVKVIQKKKISGKWLEVDFKENRDGKLKTIAFNAKKARGGMARQIVKQRITDIEELKGLNIDGYVFDDERSTEQHFLFTK